MAIRWCLNVLLLALFLLFSTVAFFLAQGGLQYVLSIFLIVVGGFVFVLVKDKVLTLIDIGWVLCGLWSIVYILYAVFDGRDLSVVVWQSLMFLMPLSQYVVRFSSIRLNPDFIIKLLLFSCFLKVPVFAFNMEEVMASFTSISGRARFHDYFSIVLVFCIFPALLYFKAVAFRWKVVLFGFFALFVVTAAHRSAYLAVIAQFFAWLFMYSGVSKSLKFRIMALGGICGVVFLTSTSSGLAMLELFINSSKGIDGNTNARIDLSATMLSDLKDYFWGHGYGFEYMYGVDSRGDGVFYALQHNSFLTPFYYLGVIPGVAFLFSLVYLTFKPISKGGSVVIYLRSVLTGMGVFAYFNLWFESPLFAIPYWIVFGWFKLYMFRQEGKK